jgi:iron complex outermembrane recepter protein
MKVKLLCSAAISCGLTTAPALAQNASLPAQEEAAVASEQGGVPEILVTAHKRTERDIDVPITISTLGGESLQKFNQTSLADAAGLVPQLVIGPVVTAVSGASINLRGIGGDAVSGSVAQPVSINIDGIQISHGSGALLGVHDMARIEVMKGPQALFYGKNSPGGVISLVSADPTRDFESLARLGYEFANAQTYGEFSASGPLTDTLSARISLYAAEQKGWFRNAANPVTGLVGPKYGRAPGGTELFGRLSLLWTAPDDSMHAKFKFSAFDANRNYGAPPYQTFACPSGRPAFSAAIPGGQTDCKIDQYYTLGDIDPKTAATHPLFRDGSPYGRGRQYLSSLEAGVKVSDNLTLTSSTGYFKTSDVSTASFQPVEVTVVVNAPSIAIEQVSQELRLSSNFSGSLNFLLGGYYEANDLAITSVPALGIFLTATPRILDNKSFAQKTDAASVFGQLTYEFTPTITLQVGGRYSHEAKTVKAYDNVANNIVILSPSKRSFNDFSPEATLIYKPNADINLYATYREGFKSGGFNLAPFTPNGADISFGQENVRGGEVGLKGYLANRTVKVQLSSYYFKYTGLQLSSFNPVNLASQLRNAGAAKVYGFEGAVLYSPTSVPGLLFNAGIGYNRAEFTEYLGPCYAGQSVALGCNLNKNGAGAFTAQNQAGRPLPRAPRWAANFGVDYKVAVGAGTRIEFGGDAQYSSSFLTDSTLDPRSRQAAFWKFNARVALAAENESWNLALIGKNLTNKLTVTSSNGAAFTGSGTGTPGAVLQDLIGVVANPRTIGLQLTMRNNIFSQ